MISEIDHSEVLGDFVVNNSQLGVISHDWLSGGAKTLITAYFLPDEVFPMRNLGDNCAPFLREIAEKQNTKWYVYKYFPDGLDNCNIMFMDWNEKIVNEPEFKNGMLLTDRRIMNYTKYIVIRLSIMRRIRKYEGVTFCIGVTYMSRRLCKI